MRATFVRSSSPAASEAERIIPENPTDADRRRQRGRRTMQTRRRRPGWTGAIGALIVLLVSGTGALAQPPVVGSTARVDQGGASAANETIIVSAPGGGAELVAGWNDWRLGNSRIAVSISPDRGATWADSILMSPAPIAAATEGDPMLAFDSRTGSVWAGGVAFSAGGVFIARKDPGSPDFEPSVVVAFSPMADKPFMVAGPRPGLPDTTRLYVVSNLGLSVSDDLGDTWATPDPLPLGVGYLPRLAPDGRLFIVYWDGTDEYRLLRSDDGGSTFENRPIAERMDVWGPLDSTRFVGQFRAPPLPYFAIDPNDGTLYFMYFDTTSFAGASYDVDLYFTRSRDGGDTWTTPVIPAGLRTDGDQFFPWIEVDDLGRIHLAYLDSGEVEQFDGVPGGLLDAFYAVSLDRGESWRSRRLTDTSWSSADDGLGFPFEFIGDYIGLTVRATAQGGHEVFPVYPVGDPAGDTDIYTRRVDYAPTADFRRGDCNGDGAVGLDDAVSFLAAYFVEQRRPALPCEKACDANDDGRLDVADAVALLTSSFGMGGPLPAPSAACGPDPTVDFQPCAVFSACP